MKEPEFAKRLQQKKSESTLEALFRAARLVNEHALSEVARVNPGGPLLRPAHTALFPHLDLKGTRVTTLAERVGISKQAVSELVDELAEMGLVERTADPSDGRAKLVKFSRLGQKRLLVGLDLLLTLEGRLAKGLGRTRMDDLRASLHALIQVLGALPPR